MKRANYCLEIPEYKEIVILSQKKIINSTLSFFFLFLVNKTSFYTAHKSSFKVVKLKEISKLMLFCIQRIKKKVKNYLVSRFIIMQVKLKKLVKDDQIFFVKFKCLVL